MALVDTRARDNGDGRQAVPVTTFAFPDLGTPRHRARRRALAVAVLVAVLAVAAAAVVAARARGGGPAGYATTTVTRHAVTRTLTNVATVAPVDQQTLAFPASGTVATVAVAPGQAVQAGQTLATLDPAPFDDAVAAKQTALTRAQLNLSAASSGTSTSSGSSGSSASNGAAGPSGNTGGGSTGAGGANGSGSAAGSGSSTDGSVTSVAAAERAVAAAQADLAVAEQARAQATLTAPAAGTVVAVSLQPGATVSASSSSATVVVVVDPAMEASTTVTVDQVHDVQVGQVASVVPDGRTEALAGKVSHLAVTPDTSGTTPTYRVTIAFDRPVTDLGNGSTAAVTITLGSVADAMAVPTSAIATTGGLRTVSVLDGDAVQIARVQVGVVGDTWTEITSGLAEGQTVVLADLAEPLPSSATDAATTSNRPGATNGDRGGLPTGGPPTGGFPGGGGGGGFRGRNGD